MKKTSVMKKLAVILLGVMLLSLFAGCAPQDTGPKIGIIQYMSHPSLDNCYTGIDNALNATGKDYNIDRQIGSANSADSDCVSYAKNMVNKNYDVIIAIATPAAKAAFAATEDTDISVIFCAVSDPVGAGLVIDPADPGYNCSGTSDVLDLQAQLNLILAFQPQVKKIGVLYTSSEENSLANLSNFKTLCEAAGIELVAKAVQNASDIPAAADALASQVDCINNFTDNNVVQNLSVVMNAAQKYNIPVYGSEVEQLKSGCLAAVSIDYVALGEATGEMAVAVLNGTDAGMLSVKTITDAVPVYNPAVLEALGLTLPEQYKDIEAVE